VDFDALENLRTKIDLSTVGKPALIGLALLIVMVAAAAGRFAIDAATATEIPLVHSEHEDDGSSSTSTSKSTDSQDAVETQVIFVHVSGAVRNSGLVELKSGARVADAIEAAGGPLDDACIDAVNLARKVEDGEHVHLPNINENVQNEESAQSVDQHTGDVAARMVNINTATTDELEQLPGIGPSTAKKINSDRETNGPYKDIEDLKRVPGIGDKKFAALEDLICI